VTWCEPACQCNVQTRERSEQAAAAPPLTVVFAVVVVVVVLAVFQQAAEGGRLRWAAKREGEGSGRKQSGGRLARAAVTRVHRGSLSQAGAVSDAAGKGTRRTVAVSRAAPAMPEALSAVPSAAAAATSKRPARVASTCTQAVARAGDDSGERGVSEAVQPVRIERCVLKYTLNTRQGAGRVHTQSSGGNSATTTPTRGTVHAALHTANTRLYESAFPNHPSSPIARQRATRFFAIARVKQLRAAGIPTSLDQKLLE
jgi:hypothetical protein